jgi:hypothetical protein
LAFNLKGHQFDAILIVGVLFDKAFSKDWPLPLLFSNQA